MELIRAPWFILEDPERPGEYLVMSAGERRFVLIWTAKDEAEAFLRGNPAAKGMRPLELTDRRFKEVFLEAARRLGAEYALFGYQPGLHEAPAAPIEKLLELVAEDGLLAGEAPVGED